MAFSTSLALLAVVLVALLPLSAVGWFDDLAPTIAAEVCDEVECGRGKCKVDGSSPVGFICECDANWKQFNHDHHHDDDDDDHRFLPCVIPNCTLNYGQCQPAPPPVPEKEVPRNLSAFDPCFWAYCGEGKCAKNFTRSHKFICECNAGFHNLLNITAFPCYSDCTLGFDCSKLGIKLADATSTDGSQATSFLPVSYQWMITLMVSVSMALWK